MPAPRHTFISSQWIPYPVDTIFAFFAQPKNLPRLMPHWQDSRIDALTLVPPPPGPNGAVSGAAGKGSRILLSFRPIPLSPVRLRWLALIDDFAWNDHFCDFEVTGPFSYWRHCHHVRAEERDGISGSLITDEVHYTFPPGMLDPIINALGGRWQIEQIFKFRQKTLPKLLAH